jgi:hypothetical protein
VEIDIPGYPGYRASEEGQIFGPRFSRPLTPRVSRGKLVVSAVVNGQVKTVAVHKLIMLAFEGPKPFANADIRHVDGDYTNNRPTNLVYGTRAQNEQDKLRHGTSNRGTRNGQSKLTPDKVRYLRRLKSQGWSNRRVAAELGISYAQVGRIDRGLDWAWLDDAS